MAHTLTHFHEATDSVGLTLPPGQTCARPYGLVHGLAHGSGTVFARARVFLVLIAMPPSANFQDVRRSLLAEIQRDFNVATLTVTSSTGVEELSATIKRVAPACIVLMNNSTVSLHREYQHAHHGTGKFPPASW